MQSVQGHCSPEVLNDVVLDERVASPAVDGKVGVAIGVVGTRVGDGTNTRSAKVSHQACSCLSRHTGQIQGSIPFHRRSCHRFPS